jgi:antitoxin (DNA-binding transcriptional repressor) of toxin-antitoxin stability system
MGFQSDDIVPMNQVRASFTELAEQVRRGREKLITRNGESYVALIDARRLDHYHRLEREHIHLTLIEEASRGLDDVAAGRTVGVAELRARYRKGKTRSRG